MRIGTCLHYDCTNRNDLGYCKTTACINYEYKDEWTASTENTHQPTVVNFMDVVEVVRCKNCKYYDRDDKSRFYRGHDCLAGRIARIDPDKDYCSRAERRDADE